MDTEDYQALMEEMPGGENHGYSAPVITTAADGVGRDDQKQPLSILGVQTQQFRHDGGWSIARGSAHRGVNHGSEYVDPGFSGLVAQALGFTLTEIESAYAPGRPTAERLDLRQRIDARFLDLQRKGGNMLALSRVLGWPIIEEKGECRKMAAALSRARAAEAQA